MLSTKFVVCLSASLLLSVSLSRGTLVVGGFSDSRVGVGTIDGIATEDLRAAILREYPDATFVTSETLTAEFLGSVDFLIAGAPSFLGAISLSAQEQQNLLNYVKAGGGALIFSDNNDYGGEAVSDSANETFLDPFGVDSAGKIDAVAFATVSAPLHKLMTEPFGHVGTVAGAYPGWFDGLGPHATAVATYDTNNQPAVLAIPRDAFAPGSGGVVFISDADMLVDGSEGGLFSVADNETLILNSIPYTVAPEPSVLSVGIGALAFLAGRRRRVR